MAFIAINHLQQGLLLRTLCFILLVFLGCQSFAKAESELADENFLDSEEPEGLQDFYRELQILLSSGNKQKERDLIKRLNPAAFSFTRGKKDLDLAELFNVPERRLNPGDFYGSRGRRGPPDGFLGSRGKRYHFSGDEQEEVPEKRQLANRFIVARGKRTPPVGFTGMRGKKSGPPEGFYGPRGKKDADPFGFYGSRGKKDVSQGLAGVQGKNTEEVAGDRNSILTERNMLRDKISRMLHLHQGKINDVAGKRQPSMGFHPLRG